MTSQQWPKIAVEADLPSIECPSHVLQWIENLPTDVLEIVSKVSENDGGIWIVGGAVRDVCLGLEVHDIDFAVTLEPEQMMDLFPDSIATGIEYGTVATVKTASMKQRHYVLKANTPMEEDLNPYVGGHRFLRICNDGISPSMRWLLMLHEKSCMTPTLAFKI